MPTLAVSSSCSAPTAIGRRPSRCWSASAKVAAPALVGVRQDGEERVAAEAAELVGLADAQPDAERHLAQRRVAAGGAVDPVDGREVVDVEQDDRDRMLVAPGLGDLDAKSLEDRGRGWRRR